MLQSIIGKKVGMTRIFTADGNAISVTVVQAGPVTVIQKKTKLKDGYDSVQIGYEELSENKVKNLIKPKTGHFKDNTPCRYLREVDTSDIESVSVGQKFDAGIFNKGELVDVSGTSKGRGFSGVIKRHNFHGGPGSHGHRFDRGTGSIGQSATPARVFKNKKMPGQYGNANVTVQNLEIVEINLDLNAILIKGSIPGPNGRLVEIKRAVKASQKAG